MARCKVGDAVIVLSNGNEGRYGTIVESLGYHPANTDFPLPPSSSIEGKAYAHKSDVWWWVEAKHDFSAFRREIRMTFFGAEQTPPKTVSAKALFFPDTELLPLPPLSEPDVEETAAPKTEKVEDLLVVEAP